MPTDEKRATVAELADQLGASKAAIVSDYRGLSVADIGTLRGGLREQGIVYRVVKNRLMKIAAQQAGRPELVELLDGPSAIAFGSGDESATAKAFVDAVRRYRQVAIRGAVLGEQRIDESGLRRLASLPSREVLLAQLAGALASPLAITAGLLSSSLRGLGAALRQLEGQRSVSASPAEAPTESSSEASPASAPPTEASPEKAAPEPASPEVASAGEASPEAASPEVASAAEASPEAASPEAASPEEASPEAASPEAASPEEASPEDESSVEPTAS